MRVFGMDAPEIAQLLPVPLDAPLELAVDPPSQSGPAYVKK